MCTTCDTATTAPRADHFAAGCDSCMARALAATGAHLESALAKRMTEQYTGALKALFKDGWEAGHEDVKRWAGLIQAADARKAAGKSAKVKGIK